jgi:hypothetical protein
MKNNTLKIGGEIDHIVGLQWGSRLVLMVEVHYFEQVNTSASGCYMQPEMLCPALFFYLLLTHK